jgi:hypothetical protein
MSRNRDINTALRSLDAADHHIDLAIDRARSDLDRILATDPSPDLLARPFSSSADRAGRPKSTAWSARRLALTGGLLAGVAACVIALPSFLGGDQAFASWTPTPDGMSAHERTDAADGCRQMQEDGAGAEYVEDLDRAEPVIAERRGVWTTVVLARTDGFSAMCITDESSHLFAKNMIGSVGTPTGHTTAGPRDLTATDLGTGTMSAGDISLMAGTCGSLVTGVVYHSRTHGDVAATVSHGHFALWLPGDELKDTGSTGVQVDVTYSDGTTGTTRLTL